MGNLFTWFNTVFYFDILIIKLWRYFIKPKIPLNEIERLKLLKNFDILDTGVEEIFDNFTKLAALICEVPICLISLVDENRQWFKSKYGLEACETPRDISFCGHAIHDNKIFYVEDATTDFRFKNNPLVTGNPKISFDVSQKLVQFEGRLKNFSATRFTF
ncbi:MAG: GAF domain-containing protein [Bacteriovoracaceae bacterium]|nr:GAF domain-containing protein [Bacteriovoracaceae bacterium]